MSFILSYVLIICVCQKNDDDDDDVIICGIIIRHETQSVASLVIFEESEATRGRLPLCRLHFPFLRSGRSARPV